MKKELTKTQNKELYYYKNEKKIGVDITDKNTYPSGLTGDISGRLTGNISGLYGNISGLTGDISELTGNISGLYGNISGLTGNISSELTGNISGLTGDCTNIIGDIDDCELTEKERKEGVNIQALVKD